MIEYKDLEKYYNKPKNWIPGKQSFFNHYKRIPRKLKKKGRRTQENMPFLGLYNCLWYNLQKQDPNYARYLTKLVIKSEY